MDYEDAVKTVVNADSLSTALLVLLALAALYLVFAQVVKVTRELRKPKDDKSEDYQEHLRDSTERFGRDERHIEQNRLDIQDLKEGQRVTCVAIMALLNHSLHNGNDKEMLEASDGLNKYLINRK